MLTQKIKLLPLEEAQKIAAGEVVERPANIIKELIENSIDAHASHISLYVEQSGKSLIRIVDNGCGMSNLDTKLCFQSHATSKITGFDQIATVNTFGFRGEALASIAAVSKVTLITKRESDKIGTKITNTENQDKEQEIACNNGTEILVSDLFYNLPVRKKFLKQNETEWNQIASLVNAFCMNNISINFKLFHDNRLILNAPATVSLRDRIVQLFGVNFSENLLDIQLPDNKPNWISVEGLVSNQHFWRHTRHHIFFFVNNRYVKNPELTRALTKGYYSVLPAGKFPAACLKITIDPELVDINCHPKKEEVRFTKPGVVETQITLIVKQTLEKTVQEIAENIAQNITQERAQNITQEITQNIAQEITQNIAQERNTQEREQENTQERVKEKVKERTPEIVQEQENYLNKKNYFYNKFIPEIQNTPVSPVFPISNTEQNLSNSSNFNSSNKITNNKITSNKITSNKIIGQLFKTYILIENENQLVLIDQHAAHERILYEKFLNQFEKKEGTLLLFPEIAHLNAHQLKLIISEKEFFSNQGIELEQISSSEVVIKTSPVQLQSGSLREFIVEAACFIEENEHLDREIFRKKLNEHVHSHMACKAAIKAGDTLSILEMSKLVKDLSETDKRFICIHGRPTTWCINKNEIEKRFKR